MQLEGSCHCKAVKFKFKSEHPYPFNRCYCSICRKTAGGGGYAINLGGDFDSLEIIQGEDCITIYQIRINDPDTGELIKSPCERRFCNQCGSALWVWDPRWPELIHPFASAIDSPLPIPPQRTHLMLGSMAEWVEPDTRSEDKQFNQYPEESIEQWHQRHGLEK